MKKKYILASILILTSNAFAEFCTVFESDFLEIPSGWHNDDWSFGTEGAHWGAFCSGNEQFEGSMGSDGEPGVWYFVPDGTDSLVIYVDYNWGAVINSGECTAYLRMQYLSGGYEELLYVHEEPTFLGGADSSVTYVVESVAAGTWIGFEAYGFVSNTYALLFSNFSISITELTVTAYGDELAFEQCTWGAVKSRFIWPLNQI